MTVSLYSFLTAVLWFSAFILLGTLLQRKADFVFCYRLVPLLLLLALMVFRLAIPVELPFTQVICSNVLYPAVQSFLYATLFTAGGTAVSCAQALGGIWALGSALLCIRLVLHIRRDKRRLRAISVVPCQCAEQCLEQLLSRRARSPRVGLVVSSELATPMLTGFVRPVILLPQACADLSAQELECILSHELTHLRSADLWVKLLVRLLCCFMWWNPCVYLLQKDLDRVLEYKCDLTVTKTMPPGERLEYLQSVLDVLKLMEDKASAMDRTQTLQACFCEISENAVLRRRFHLVLHPRKRHGRLPAAALMAASILLFVSSYFVVFQPASEAPFVEGEVIITPETCYILAASGGKYYVVCEGREPGEISPHFLRQEPFCSLNIRTEREVE